MFHNKPIIDIVIISDAKTDELKRITQNSLDSLFESEKEYIFKVIVVESNNKIDYKHTNTIHPKENNISFGYNKYLNIGRKLGNSPYVCLCNNDLEYHPGWTTNILNKVHNTDIMSASPFDNNSHPRKRFKKNTGIYTGYETGKELAGWCIFQKRSIYDIIGDLDENFIFWYADDDYGKTLKYYNLKHILVTDSFVDHLESRTLQKVSIFDRSFMTDYQLSYFVKKWGMDK